jgi:hypothetical protein
LKLIGWAVDILLSWVEVSGLWDQAVTVDLWH